MNLEFEKYCKVDQSPRTVLPSSHHNAKHERSSNKKPKSSSRNNQLSLEGQFNEIKCRDYHRSVSCKTLPTSNTELAIDREVLKRGSIYQSSKETTPVKRHDSVNGRKKIEFSVSGAAPFSFTLLDSICGSDEEEEVRESSSSRPAERDFLADSKLKSHEVVCPSSTANVLKEPLQKSLSAKLMLPHSPTHSDSDVSKGKQGSRFTPVRNILDPLTYPKSHQSLTKDTLGPRKKALRKSLLHDFSCTTPQIEKSRNQYVSKDQEEIAPPCSPAHLHGDLKLEHKHGVPYFELSLPHLDYVLAAKTWKGEDALNWVYTFHSFQGRKKNNTGSNKDLPMVGQMQVSCHLCSELKGGALTNSVMTNFVLYDIMHARKSLEAEELGASCHYPWAEADLHPSYEVAAIDIQVPFEKRESLKHRSNNKFDRHVHLSLLDLPLAEQTSKGIADGSSTTMVTVVTPLGHHSLPTCESRGPSALLDRWRLGGGCDCGGWDMACPLVVFDNLSTRCEEEGYSLVHSNQPFNLYLKGAKEKTAALTMKSTRKGRYSVDFHAQLSALQAFGICVAILHASEASPAADQEKHNQLLQCASKKALVDDEVKILTEAITEEEKDKGRAKAVKATENHPPSFVLNPPFSPIARV